MNWPSLIRGAATALLLLSIAGCTSGTPSATERGSDMSYEELVATTPAYRSAALAFLLSEANWAAKHLELPETLPITTNELTGVYISPPRLARGTGAIGNIRTKHFIYCVAQGRKLSYVMRNFGQGSGNMTRDYDELEAKFTWPTTRMDTNAARVLAVKWLEAISVDVNRLNREAQVKIRAWTSRPGVFVPLYWVVWGRDSTTLASVELFAPSQSLRQVRVEDGTYIGRNPFDPNWKQLLEQTN